MRLCMHLCLHAHMHLCCIMYVCIYGKWVYVCMYLWEMGVFRIFGTRKMTLMHWQRSIGGGCEL